MNRLHQKDYQIPIIPQSILPFPNLPSLHIPSHRMMNTEFDSFPIYHHSYAMHGSSPIISPSFNPQLQLPPFVDVVYPASPLPFNHHHRSSNVRIYDVNDMISENSSINTTDSSHSSCINHSSSSSNSNNNVRIIDIPRFFKSESPAPAAAAITTSPPCSNLPTQPKEESVTEESVPPSPIKSSGKPKGKKLKKIKQNKKLHVCSECNKTFKYKSVCKSVHTYKRIFDKI